jgi:hypothetical protein
VKEENIILSKTYDFGLRILKLYLHLRKNRVDIALCSQLLIAVRRLERMSKKQLAVHREKILLINFKSPTRNQEKQGIGYDYLKMERL